MRKTLTLLLALCALCATAETRRLLTMEEAILSRELIPQNYSVLWSQSHPDHFLHKDGDSWIAIDVRTGKEQPAEAPAISSAMFKCEGCNIFSRKQS